MNSFYSQEELSALGFASFGKNVSISKLARFYNPSKITLGNSVRIDDFCILSGAISIGSYVHIAPYCCLFADDLAPITLHNFSGLSSRVSIYAKSDDYSGNYLTNPTVPAKFTNILSAPVTLEKHVIVGASSVILPGVVIAEGAAIGAMSLVRENLEAFTIYAGIPAKKRHERTQALLQKELDFMYC